MGTVCTCVDAESDDTQLNTQRKVRFTAMGDDENDSDISPDAEFDKIEAISHRRLVSVAYPICFECGGDFKQKSDPMQAYNGVGIVCDMCGFSKDTMMEIEDEKEKLERMPLFYYACTQCNSVDLCVNCYDQQYTDLKAPTPNST